MIGYADTQARSSLFTRDEKNDYRITEVSLVAKAKQGDIHPLLKFWDDKRNLMNLRADIRMRLV